MADCVVVAPSDITGDDVRDALALTRKGGTCVLTGMAPRPGRCRSTWISRTWS